MLLCHCSFMPGCEGQAVLPTEIDPETKAFDPAAPMKRIGGHIDTGEGIVSLRVLVDHSCVEVFTGRGEALSTRQASISHHLWSSALALAELALRGLPWTTIIVWQWPPIAAVRSMSEDTSCA